MPNRPFVREQEILRVVLEIKQDSTGLSYKNACREILYWAQKRSGQELPNDAWEGNDFTQLIGGRTIMVISHHTDRYDTWAMRAHDPDKTVAGRIWTTEATIGIGDNIKQPILGVRLLVSTTEDNLCIEPHVPGFLQQISQNIGLISASYNLESNACRISSCEDANRLIEMLKNKDRVLPVIVITEKNKSDRLDKTTDADLLARATIGLAHVVIVSSDYTDKLRDAFGKFLSVSDGSIRIYMPGFDQNSEPYDHILFLSEHFQTDQEKIQCYNRLRIIAAKESLLRVRLNEDIDSFSSLQSLILKVKQNQQQKKSIIKSNIIKISQERIDALEEEIKQAKDWEQQLIYLHSEAEDRAKIAESELHSASCRIHVLTEQLTNNGQKIDEDIPEYPNEWSEFLNWYEKYLIGRVSLASAARRNIKKPDFRDVSLVARCVEWLAKDYRDIRMYGREDVLNYIIESGVRNAPCGGDSFSFEFRGERLNADWHIKKGGNTHDPLRCLRIYYSWDPRSQQVVIADMPAHKRTPIS